MLERTHPRVRGLKRRSRRIGGFYPTQVSAISSWLRLAASTPNAGEYDAVVDVLNSNPTAQTDADRKPAASTSANGLPTMLFDGSDMLTWPQQAAGTGNNGTTKWGMFFTFKPTSNLVTRQRVLSQTFAVSAPKVTVDIVGGALEVNFFRTSVDGRAMSITSGVTASAWNSAYVLFDGSQSATDALAMQLYINGVQQVVSFANQGAGGAMTTLQSVSGAILIGASSDSDTPSAPLLVGCELGPNMMFMTDNLSATQIAALHAFERPT